jgi:UDP-N-acetylmuramate--alanine ligase
VDDPIVRETLPEVSRPMLTYGFSEDADFRAISVSQTGTRTHFVVERPFGASALQVTLNLPGKHNVLNALAAIAVATELKVSDAAIVRALDGFAGIGRRFQICGDFPIADTGSVTLIDDYGHHPREIAATLQAARESWPERRLVMVYQPHRYTRTRDLMDDFRDILSKPDALVLLDVYSAGEPPIPGADGQSLAQKIREHGAIDPVFIERHDQLPEALAKTLRPNDVLLMQGAGNIGTLAANLAATQLREVADILNKTTVNPESSEATARS